MDYQKCKDCRWVEFVNMSQLDSTTIQMVCKITGETKKLKKCIKQEG